MNERQFLQLWARLVTNKVAGQWRDKPVSSEGKWRWTRLPKLKAKP